MSNLLTVSRLKVWRDCRRKHRLMYLDGVRSATPGEALRFGSLIHTGLEGWWKSDGDRLKDAIRAILGRGYDEYDQVAAEELLLGYHNRWGADERYEVLSVEESFFVSLVNPETGASSRTWSLAGKLDGVIRDRDTGAVLILEHKTTTDSFDDPAHPYWMKLGMDAQISQYYLGAESLGFRPEGCLYDVLLRPRKKPLQATPESKRKYKANGALYAKQREHDETPEEYRIRLREDIASSPDKYFARRDFARTDADIVEYLGDVWAEGRMMREAELAGRAPRNPESCHRFGTCSFWEVCAYGVNPADHPDHYRVVDDVHPELELLETV